MSDALTPYRERAAQAWCQPSTGQKVMDPELAEEFAKILQAEIARLQGERDEAQTQLGAWQRIFGTTQLTHASARLTTAEAERERLREELERVAQTVHQAHHETGTWRNCQKIMCSSIVATLTGPAGDG